MHSHDVQRLDQLDGFTAELKTLPASKKTFPLYLQILAGMAVGAATGVVFGPRAEVLGEFGKVIIQLIKALAGPLLFFAVIDAFLKTHIRLRAAGVMLAIGLVNAAAALTIGMGLSNLLRPGELMHFNLPAAGTSAAVAGAGKKIDFVTAVTGIIPTSVFAPFVDNSVLTIIFLAILAGLALRKIKNEQKTGERFVLEEIVTSLLRAVEITLGWVVRLVPLAVFGVVAKTVGQQGFAPLKGLSIYLSVALLGLALQIGVVYQIWLVAALGPSALGRFWRGSRDAIIYALGASSSLATLPVTLRCLDRMGVSTQSARLAACVGSNFNHDGILLYEAMAVLFVAQVHGIHLTMGQQALTAVTCMVAAVGIAGIPDAGFISLALVLSTVGLPLEILPLLLTVDWVLSRARAITNVLSDIVMSVLLDHFMEPKKDYVPTTARH